MADIATWVTRLGGFAQKQQLVALGARDLDLTRAVRAGEVSRARQGWYTTLQADDPRVRAVRVGGRLTGLSAIAAVGGWVVDSRQLHVSVPTNAARLRSARNRHARFITGRGATVHWDDPSLMERGTSWRVAIADALTRVVMDEPFEDAVAALDWAVHSGAIDEFDFELVIAALPAPLRAIREWVDPACESLPESLARTRLRQAGHHVVSQVRLRNDQRIDLVVDGQIGVEIDGKKWHFDTFDSDRDKDVEITLERFHALRPSAQAVFQRWERVQVAVTIALDCRGIALPSEIQGFGLRSRRRVPKLLESHNRRKTEVLNFRKVRRE